MLTGACVILSLGLGLTVLVAIMLIEGNMSRQVQESIPQKAPAFFFIDIQAEQMTPFEQSIVAIPGVEDLQKVPYFRGRIVAVNGQPPEQLLQQYNFKKLPQIMVMFSSNGTAEGLQGAFFQGQFQNQILTHHYGLKLL